MKLNELKSGMIIQYRNKETYLLIDYDSKLLAIPIKFTNAGGILIGGHNVITNNYSDDLKHKTGVNIIKPSNWDIMKVVRPISYNSIGCNNNMLLWERNEEIPEYTVEDLIKLVGHEFKIKK